MEKVDIRFFSKCPFKKIKNSSFLDLPPRKKKRNYHEMLSLFLTVRLWNKIIFFRGEYDGDGSQKQTIVPYSLPLPSQSSHGLEGTEFKEYTTHGPNIWWPGLGTTVSRVILAWNVWCELHHPRFNELIYLPLHNPWSRGCDLEQKKLFCRCRGHCLKFLWSYFL